MICQSEKNCGFLSTSVKIIIGETIEFPTYPTGKSGRRNHVVTHLVAESVVDVGKVWCVYCVCSGIALNTDKNCAIFM